MKKYEFFGWIYFFAGMIIGVLVEVFKMFRQMMVIVILLFITGILDDIKTYQWILVLMAVGGIFQPRISKKNREKREGLFIIVILLIAGIYYYNELF